MARMSFKGINEPHYEMPWLKAPDGLQRNPGSPLPVRLQLSRIATSTLRPGVRVLAGSRTTVLLQQDVGWCGAPPSHCMDRLTDPSEVTLIPLPATISLPCRLEPACLLLRMKCNLSLLNSVHFYLLESPDCVFLYVHLLLRVCSLTIKDRKVCEL